MPEALQSPLQRRSQYLAEVLKQQANPGQIQGWGELAARLLAQGITGTALNRTEDALANEEANAALRRRQQIGAAIGLPVEGEMRDVGDGRFDPLKGLANLVRGRREEPQPEPAPAAPPQAPQPSFVPNNTQEPVSSPIAPVGPVEGAPLPVPGQTAPQAPVASQATAPAAPQPAPSPLGPTPEERALIGRYLNSGDPAQVAMAEKMVQEIELRQAQPAWQRGEFQAQNGVGGFYDPATNRWTPIAGGIPQEAQAQTFLAGSDNEWGVAPGTLLQRSPNGVVSVVNKPPEGMAREGGRIVNEPGYVEATTERARASQGIEIEGQRERDRPQFEARIGRIAETTRTIREEVAYAQRIIAENPGAVGLLGSMQARIPGTPAYDLAQSLGAIQANIGFEYLQDMRNSNPTGGGVGALTDSERQALGDTAGSLAQGQSAARLGMSLSRIDRLTQSGYQRAQSMYDSTYGRAAPQQEQPRQQQRPQQRQSAPAPRQPTLAEVEAEMKRRGLL